jgi:hypothetical protein
MMRHIEINLLPQQSAAWYNRVRRQLFCAIPTMMFALRLIIEYVYQFRLKIVLDVVDQEMHDGLRDAILVNML